MIAAKRLLAAAATLALAGCSGSASRQSSTSSTTTAGPPGSVVPTTGSVPLSTTTAGRGCSAASVIAGWPVARRAAQLLVVPALGADPEVIEAALSAGAGGVLLIGSLPAAGPLSSDLRRARGHHILVMVDQEGGGVQRLDGDVISLPWPRQMAATMSTATVQALAARLGRQMVALGVNVDLAPVLDLDGGPSLSTQDPDGPRSFSTDPATAAAYGQAFVSGLESGGVLAVVKHFPGLGSATGNTDYGPASTQPIAVLDRAGLVPFERAVKAGARAVMVANAAVPGVSGRPASVSAAVITGILRDRLGFGGLVLTDSLSAGAVRSAGLDVPGAAVAAVEAGADMVLWGSTLTAADTAQLAPGPVAAERRAVVAAITKAVADGGLPVSRLDQAVLHVVQADGADLCAS